jgi:hypothetical protein
MHSLAAKPTIAHSSRSLNGMRAIAPWRHCKSSVCNAFVTRSPWLGRTDDIGSVASLSYRR